MEKIYKNLAVFYRGHLRTWKYVKDVNFSIFQSIADNVDYYFTTWNEPYLDIKDLENDFKNRNLIKILTLEKDNIHFNPWFSTPWMIHNILPFKAEREKTVKYDAVIDIRPDVMIYRATPENLIPNTYYTKFEAYYHEWSDLGVSDICTIVTSETFDKLAGKLNFEIDCHPEPHLRNFLLHKDIKIIVSPIIGATIIRPITVDKIKDPFEILKLGDIGQKFMDAEWQRYNLNDRLSYMEKYNINYLDYVGWNILMHVAYDTTNNFDKVKKSVTRLPYSCMCGCT